MTGSRRDLMAWAAPVSAMAVMAVSLSLSHPLFSLLLERQGHSGTVIGLNHTLVAVTAVLSAPLLPRIMAQVGLVPLMLGSLLLMAFSMAAIPLWPGLAWWSVLRLLWGIAGTALFFASEYWVVTKAPEHLRGRIVGAYVVILSGSYMAGPALLNAIGIEGTLIYVIPTLLILAAMLPVIVGRHLVPEADEAEVPPRTAETLRIFRTDPLMVGGVVLFGVIEFGALGLLPVWGLRAGFTQETAVMFGFWLAFGSMAFQLPVGWAADRFDRRRLMAIGAVVCVAVPFAMLGHGGQAWIVAAAVFIWGGTAVAFYSVALTELGARYKGGMMARANAAVVLAYGVGSLISPAAFGAAMDAVPPDGILWLAGAAGCVYLALALIRISRTQKESLDTTPSEDR